MDEINPKEVMVKALIDAGAAWKEAEMPRIFTGYQNEAGKIALAMIANKLFDFEISKKKG